MADTPPDPRSPVLVGIGTADRPSQPSGEPGPLEPVELMIEATLAALADSGVAALAARVGSVAVPVGNWSYADPARLVADAVGAHAARTVRVEIGVPQQTPVRVAFERIRRGELDAAIVVGGEAKATQLRRSRAGLEVLETDQGDTRPDEVWAPTGEIISQSEIDAGLWQPVEQFACIDNALAAAEGRSADQHLDEIADLWARCNRVAATFPAAAFPEPRSAGFLRSAGPGNRPLAYPYAKWHSTQWAVDQAGAMVLCSLALADELGVPSDRRVHPSVLVESSQAVPLSCRAEPHRWPAMEVLGAATAQHLGHPLSEIRLAEVYSCFPAAVRVQQRALGLPLDGTPTVMGAMAFAGGPFNNFTYQATAAVVERLRAVGDRSGAEGRAMVTTVSGLLTKPAIAVWSTRPDPAPLVGDLVEAATAATETRASVSQHRGGGTVVTCTATYDRSTDDGWAPASAFVIADIDPGTRWVGRSTDADLVAAVCAGQLIGAAVHIDGDTCRLAG